MSIKVRDILELKPFTGATIVAGEGGLDRNINCVSLIEVPESMDWFKRDELYITAFYSMRDNIARQKATLQKINQCKAAGICYIDLYVYDLDTKIKEFADNNKIPIIRVPHAVPYSSMISAIMGKILQKKNMEILYSYQFKDKILKLFKTGSLDEFFNVLEGLIGNPIIYIKKDGIITSQAVMDIPRKEIDDIVASVKAGNGKGVYEYSTYNIRVGGYNEKLVVINLRNDSLIGKTVNTDYTVDHIIEVSRLVLSFHRHSSILADENKDKLANNLFNTLLKEHSTDEEISKILAETDLLLKNRFIAVIFSSDSTSKNSLSLLKNGIYGVFHYKEAIVFNKNNMIIVLLSTDKTTNEIKERILVAFSGLQNYSAGSLLNNKDDCEDNLYIAIGSVAENIRDFRTSYKNALEALEVITRLGLSNTICSFEDVCIFSILTKNKYDKTIGLFINNILHNLLKKEHKVYLDTLYNYLNLNEDRYRTAEKMNIHYNTVKYRIDKASGLLGVDFGTNKYLVYLALVLYSMRLGL